MRHQTVLAAYEFGAHDDGRAVGIGFALAPSVASLPETLSAVWNPDQTTLSAADFASRIAAVTAKNVGWAGKRIAACSRSALPPHRLAFIAPSIITPPPSSLKQETGALGCYRFERTREEAVADGCIPRAEPVALTRTMTAEVQWNKAQLDMLVETGGLGDADPPVLEATLANQQWVDGGVWGLVRRGRGGQWTPTSFEILVMEGEEPNFCFQGVTEEPDGFLCPAFVP
jgi:hypothetical protein